MRINNINTQVKLTTRNNSNDFKYNNINQSSAQEEQITFKGKLVNVAKTIIRKKIRTKMPLVSGLEATDVQKIKNAQIAETPSATNRLTEPIKWEIRESIDSQPFDNNNKDEISTETTEPKSTNLLNLIG